MYVHMYPSCNKNNKGVFKLIIIMLLCYRICLSPVCHIHIFYLGFTFVTLVLGSGVSISVKIA